MLTEEQRLNRIGVAASIVAVSAVLAACGGGGGGTPPTSSSTPAPTPSPTPQYTGPVSATGKLVDHESGNPLARIQVGLAPWIAGATPVPQPTTDASGNFTVTAPAPGKYLLVIGSNLAADPNNRPTIHEAIALSATQSPQPLTAPTMPPISSTAPNPIEQSGNFRLTTLTANEQSCLSIENTKRSGLSYAPVVPDEWLTENVRMWIQQETNAGGIHSQGGLTNYSGFDGLGCQAMVANDYTTTANMGGGSIIWYAGDEISSSDGAEDEGMYDPRAPLPVNPIGPTPIPYWPSVSLSQ